jgi:hypothetical protein
LRSKDQGWQNVAEKNRTKAAGRLRFFVARAAEGGEAYTDLLGAVWAFYLFLYSFIAKLLNSFTDISLNKFLCHSV